MIQNDENIYKFDEYYQNLRATYIRLYNSLLSKFDNDTIHDLRVCTRRLLAFINFYLTYCSSPYSDMLIKNLKFYFKKLSRLRDIQIILENNKIRASKNKKWEKFLSAISKKEQKLFKKLKTFFSNDNLSEMQGLLFFFGQDLKKSLKKNEINLNKLIQSINKQFDIVIDRFNKINIENLPTIHKFRIEFKKFRYLYEIFLYVTNANLTPSKELGKFQTMLGEIQDSDVLAREIAKFIGKTRKFDYARDILFDALDERTKFVARFIQKKDEVFKFWDKDKFSNSHT